MSGSQNRPRVRYIVERETGMVVREAETTVDGAQRMEYRIMNPLRLVGAAFEFGPVQLPANAKVVEV